MTKSPPSMKLAYTSEAFRLWFANENKYAGNSLRTRIETTAVKLYKEFGFTAGMLKGELAEGRK